MKRGKIIKVSGPLVVAEGIPGIRMYDIVRVSEKRLIGEVIEIRGDRSWIQVYEETTGLGPGEPVETTGRPLSVELGPGLIEAIYDGIQRPLDAIAAEGGDRVTRGIEVPALPRDKKWEFTPHLSEGALVQPGDILGVVQETTLVEHKIMVPPGVEGRLVQIKAGACTVEEIIAKVETKDGIQELALMQRWPVRRDGHTGKNRPYPTANYRSRSIDTFFPVAQGGTAGHPRPFGSGKPLSNTNRQAGQC